MTLTHILRRLPVTVALVAALIGGSVFAERSEGWLRDGASAYSEWIYLERGDMVTAVGECDWDCSDLDLYLLDEDGDVMDRDTADDDSPVLAFMARYEGWYRVRTHMAGCDGVCVYTTDIDAY